MSGIYAKAKEKMLTGKIDVTGTLNVVGINKADYIVDYSLHEFYSSVTSAVCSPVTLTGVTYANGKLTADGAVLVSPTKDCDAVIVYISTGVAATSPLLCYIDDGDELPSLATNGDISIDWDTNLGILTI